jgi:heptosyltransferase-3
VEYHLDALRTLGVEPGEHLMSLHYPAEAEQSVRNALEQNGVSDHTPYAVVHPSSRWMFKAWTYEGNAAVIDYLTREKGLRVAVTAAPVEKELDFVKGVLSKTQSDVVDLTGRLDLMELAALIDGARMHFGVDSLPMHMAAALSTPTVALFGPSADQIWGPWGRGHEVIAKSWDCRPCHRDGCGGSKISRCLVEIEPEEVFPALDRVLKGAA